MWGSLERACNFSDVRIQPFRYPPLPCPTPGSANPVTGSQIQVAREEEERVRCWCVGVLAKGTDTRRRAEIGTNSGIYYIINKDGISTSEER